MPPGEGIEAQPTFEQNAVGTEIGLTIQVERRKKQERNLGGG